MPLAQVQEPLGHGIHQGLVAEGLIKDGALDLPLDAGPLILLFEEAHDLGGLKTSFSGTFHAFNFAKYARRYLGGYFFRFNRRFSMAGMTERIANAVCCCMPLTERDLRVAEAYG